ncbi:hypothetical protein CDAR_491711 [Caerostris darwini]|uniref:Uncharacterized protein n=1 Tax=Caerostris darwini TaxID=1538125 RepID=A0AAV4MYW8_9ARAC|nr:hypothetical protein CDAR_491711 [Caerostris darwini]
MEPAQFPDAKSVPQNISESGTIVQSFLKEWLLLDITPNMKRMLFLEIIEPSKPASILKSSRSRPSLEKKTVSWPAEENLNTYFIIPNREQLFETEVNIAFYND